MQCRNLSDSKKFFSNQRKFFLGAKHVGTLKSFESIQFSSITFNTKVVYYILLSTCRLPQNFALR